MQILTRKQRGDKIASSDIVQINLRSFFVKSQTGKSGYSVTKTGQTWACDCPDYRFHQKPCKHIYAVESLISEQTIASRFKLRLWEASI